MYLLYYKEEFEEWIDEGIATFLRRMRQEYVLHTHNI